MKLIDKINADLKTAMKAKDKESLQAIRAVKSAILLANTEAGSSELTEADEIKMLQKLVKQRRDAAEIYKTQGRDDMFKQEDFEANLITKYLPAQLSDEEVVAILKEIIASVGASSPKEMGRVMGLASKQLAGKADGKTISTKVKELLS